MANLGLTKNLKATGAIAERRFVKFGSNDGEVVQAAAATDSIIGVCVQPGGAASGDRCDVQLGGIAEVEFGGSVTRGGPVTSDGSGKAVAAAPAQGVNNRLGGIAMNSQASADFGDVLLAPSVMQGA